MNPLRSRPRHLRLALPIIVLLLLVASPLPHATAARPAQGDTTTRIYLPLTATYRSPPLLFRRTLAGGSLEIYVMQPDGSGQTNLTNNPSWDVLGSWSPRNRKIALISDRNGHRDIYTMNLDGSGPTNLTNTPRSYGSPTWSPDGTKIAFIVYDSGYNLYVMNADGSGMTKLTTKLTIRALSWSPDSMRIAFEGYFNIYVIQADGSRETQISRQRSVFPTWSPDGRQIAFISSYDDTDCPKSTDKLPEIALASPNGSVQTRLTHTKGSCIGGYERIYERPPQWSPSGDRIAFVNILTGKSTSNAEIYTINADGSNKRDLTNSAATEGDPVWSPLGDRLAFVRYYEGTSITSICTVNADGSGLTRLTSGWEDNFPVWAE